MYLVLQFLLLLNSSSIGCDRNCCLKKLNKETTDKFVNGSLTAICNACLGHLIINMVENVDKVPARQSNYPLHIRRFFESLENSFDSSNGMIYCVDNYKNHEIFPLYYSPERHSFMLFKNMPDLKNTINFKLMKQIDEYYPIYSGMCEYMINLAKLRDENYVLNVEGYFSIYEFKIFS